MNGAEVLQFYGIQIKFYYYLILLLGREGREGTCLFDINIKHNTEIFIGKIISGDSH